MGVVSLPKPPRCLPQGLVRFDANVLEKMPIGSGQFGEGLSLPAACGPKIDRGRKLGGQCGDECPTRHAQAAARGADGSGKWIRHVLAPIGAMGFFAAAQEAAS